MCWKSRHNLSEFFVQGLTSWNQDTGQGCGLIWSHVLFHILFQAYMIIGRISFFLGGGGIELRPSDPMVFLKFPAMWPWTKNSDKLCLDFQHMETVSNKHVLF